MSEQEEEEAGLQAAHRAYIGLTRRQICRHRAEDPWESELHGLGTLYSCYTH